MLVLLLIIPLAVATEIPVFEKDPITVNNSFPEITVVYQEPVDIIDVYIIKLSNSSEIGVEYTTSDNQSYIMNPEIYLTNEDYQLHIISEDQIGNPSEVIQNFTVLADFMPIWLDLPELGVSSTQVFDAVLKTGMPATCKYSMFFIPPPQINNYNFLFDLNEETTHTILGVNTNNSFFLNDNSPDEGGKERTIYVKCTDQNNLVHPTSVYLAYDTTPPSLGVVITPNPIIDSHEPNATLEVQTTDRTVCTYTENAEYGEFPNYDPEDFEAYQKEHYLTLDFTDLAMRPVPDLFDEETFDYEITCTNLAGLTSDVATITATVAFGDTFIITINEPDQYTNDEIIDLEIETNIETLGGCRYGEGNNANEEFDDVIGNKLYSAELGELEEGTYTYTVECSDIGYQEKTFNFTVDRTKPTNITIEMALPQCSLDDVNARLFAEDEQSGIDFFNYSISLGAETLIEGITDSEINEAADLEENTVYQLNVIAYDKAGNFEEASTSFTAVNNTDPSCDNEPPTTDIETVVGPDGVLITVNCYDSGSGCQQLFNYGMSAPEEECTYTANNALGQQILITEDVNFCWTVYDNNYNNASGEEFVMFEVGQEYYPENCFNNITDGDETDIDCGGSCPACTSLGSACTTNEDCQSLSCNPITGVCEEASCENEYKDGSETYIDCGGDNCTPCEIGEGCKTDDDCLSGYCSPYNICAEELNDNESVMKNQSGLQPTIGTEKKSIAIPLTFIIIGLLLIISGVVYLYLETKKKDSDFQPRLIDEKGKMPATQVQKIEETPAKRIIEEKTFEKRSLNKKKQRKKLLDEFETDIEDKGPEAKEEKTEEEKPEKEETEEKEEKEKEKKESQTPAKKKTSNDEMDEYVELSDLKKEDELREEDMGKDIFQQLEAIKNDTAGGDEEKTEEKAEKKKKPEKGESEDQDGEEDSEPELGFESNETNKSDKSIKKQKSKTSEIEKPEESMSTDDIFKKLAELSGETHENVKKAVDKDEVSSKDLIKVFANVTSKKQIDANVFKAILSQLLKRGQVSKQTVADILFEFMETKLLTKKEVSRIMKDLNLTGK